MLWGLQIALAGIGFTIIPTFAGELWSAAPAAFRWTVYASQCTLLLSGFVGGGLLPLWR